MSLKSETSANATLNSLTMFRSAEPPWPPPTPLAATHNRFVALPYPPPPSLDTVFRQILEVTEKARLRILAPGEAASWLNRLADQADSWLSDDDSTFHAEGRIQAAATVAEARDLIHALTDAESRLFSVAEGCRTFLQARTS
jgi:hypothetical protein